MGVEALRQLGFRSYQALRAARIFRAHEERGLRASFEMSDDAYISHVRNHITELDRLIAEDDRDFRDSADGAWEPSPPSSEASKISDKDGAASQEHVRLRLL